MILRLILCAALVAPLPAAARSLDGEGTVSVLPTVRHVEKPRGLFNQGLVPGLTLAFGYKPSRDLRVGIDVGITFARGELDGGRYHIEAVPLLLAFDWILLPASDVRPVLQAAIGREFLAVSQGTHYREYIPTVIQVGGGLHADLSDWVGILADAGYLFFGRATDPRLGRVDGGGPFARLGVTFRFEPERGPR